MSSLSIASGGFLRPADSTTLTLLTFGFLSFSNSQIVGIPELDLAGKVIQDGAYIGKVVSCDINGKITYSSTLEGKIVTSNITGSIPSISTQSYTIPTTDVEGYELFKPIPINATTQRSRNLQGVLQYTTTMEIVQPGSPKNFSGEPINTYTYISPIDVS